MSPVASPPMVAKPAAAPKAANLAALRVRFASAAKLVLRDGFGKEFQMPEPAAFPTAAVAPQNKQSTNRRGTKREQLRKLAYAYAFYVEIRNSGKTKAYEKSLRDHHGIVRKRTDLISLILRSVIPLNSKTVAARKRATRNYSEWTAAIRYCLRMRIRPDELVDQGTPGGQGITAWTRAQRHHVTTTKGTGKPALASTKRPQSITKATTKLLKKSGDRALIEIERRGTNSFHLEVVRIKKLQKVNVTARNARWKRIIRAAHLKPEVT